MRAVGIVGWERTQVLEGSVPVPRLGSWHELCSFRVGVKSSRGWGNQPKRAWLMPGMGCEAESQA